jgi:Domain of unknown function (DUF4234)
MAQPVDIGAEKPAKIRSVVWVAVLTLVTLAIYLGFWWYFINREMADYGRRLGTPELGDSPAKSVLALTLGALVVVPAVWTTVTTFKRVQALQRLTGEAQPINGWIGLILLLVISPALYGYMQSGLNGAWRAVATERAQAAAV